MVSSYGRNLSKYLRAHVMCYEYSGYGLSTGTPSEAGCNADIQAAFNHLVKHHKISATRIILLGRSIGCGPTVHLAAQLGRQLAGVILVGAAASCLRVACWGKRSCRGDMFASVDRIGDIEVPVLLVHGTSDAVVPFRHSVELARRARFPLKPLWVRGAHHNDLEEMCRAEVFARYWLMMGELRRWHDLSGDWDDGTRTSSMSTETKSGIVSLEMLSRESIASGEALFDPQMSGNHVRGVEKWSGIVRKAMGNCMRQGYLTESVEIKLQCQTVQYVMFFVVLPLLRGRIFD